MLKALSRVTGGFVLACLTAGLVTVAFVVTPMQLASVPGSAFPQKISEFGELMLLTATHSAIFASAFALVATVVGEWLTVRSALYYAIVGAAIALLGFFAQYSSEIAGQPTVLNTYAIAAFLAAGLAAGLVYWATAGRYAGGEGESASDDDASVASRPRIIVETSEGERPRRNWALKKALDRARLDTGRAMLPEEPAADTIPGDNRRSSMSEPVTSVPSTKPATRIKVSDNKTERRTGAPENDEAPSTETPPDAKPD